MMPVPRPTPTTPIQEELYEALEPLAWADEEEGWPLLIYCGAIATMFDQVDHYVRDQIEYDNDGNVVSEIPGWYILFDPDLCPEEALPHLAQFKGVALPTGLTAAQQRQAIKDASARERGTVGAVESAVKAVLSGTKTVFIKERKTLVETDYKLKNLLKNPGAGVDTSTWSSGNMTLARTTSNQKSGPGGFSFTALGTGANHNIRNVGVGNRYPVVPGRRYFAAAEFKTNGVNDARVARVYLDWYDSESNAVRISNDIGANINPTSPAWTRAKVSAVAPPGAYWGQVIVEVVSVNPTDTITTYVDEIIVGEVADATMQPAYGDGSFAGWSWDGTAHLSTSTRTPTRIGTAYYLSATVLRGEMPKSDLPLKNLCIDPTMDGSQWLAGSGTYFLSATTSATPTTVVDAKHGSKVLRVTCPNTVGAQEGAQIGIIGYTFKQGVTYRIGAWVRRVSGPAGVAVGLFLGEGSDSFNSPIPGGSAWQPSQVIGTAWQYLETLWVPSADRNTAVRAGVKTWTAGGAPGTPYVFDIDAVTIVPDWPDNGDPLTPELPDYFDGNSGPNYSWDGTPNASFSTRIPTEIVKNAFLSQKPAGLLYDIVVIPTDFAPSYALLLAHRSTYNDTLSSYGSYDTLRTNP